MLRLLRCRRRMALLRRMLRRPLRRPTRPALRRRRQPRLLHRMLDRGGRLVRGHGGRSVRRGRRMRRRRWRHRTYRQRPCEVLRGVLIIAVRRHVVRSSVPRCGSRGRRGLLPRRTLIIAMRRNGGRGMLRCRAVSVVAALWRQVGGARPVMECRAGRAWRVRLGTAGRRGFRVHRRPRDGRWRMRRPGLGRGGDGDTGARRRRWA